MAFAGHPLVHCRHLWLPKGRGRGRRRRGGVLVGAFELVLLDEVPAVGGAAAFEEVSEGGAGVAFGGVAVLLKGGEGFEVGFYGLVGGF